jgi:protein-S-isoprenylcysteine O-methyltransferase Ste14
MLYVVLQVIACLGVLFGGPFFVPAHPVASGLQLAGFGVGIWAVVTMRRFNLHPELKSDSKLVTHGPFRWVRNPMYLALLLCCAPPCMLAPYLPMQILAFVLLVIVLLLKIRAEEKLLHQAFPEDYAAYAARTKRLIPFVL